MPISIYTRSWLVIANKKPIFPLTEWENGFPWYLLNRSRIILSSGAGVFTSAPLFLFWIGATLLNCVQRRLGTVGQM